MRVRKESKPFRLRNDSCTPVLIPFATDRGNRMQDVIYVAVLFAFFGLAALFVVGCDRIIGSDQEALAQGVAGEAAADPSREKTAA
jgi:hypothetical protein